MRPLTAAEIQKHINEDVVIHVLPEEHYQCAHIPGAVNACVYEMTFLDKVAELMQAKDKGKNSPIIVYGAGGGSLDAEVAAEKLRHAGYTSVEAYTGGLAEWVETGHATEGSGAPAKADTEAVKTAPADGTFSVDTEQSVVRWTGRNLFNHHHGTLKLAGGEITVKDGALTAARFTLDMTSIVNEDLTDPDYNALLIRHLKDDDFFAVERFPTAEYVCAEALPLPGCTPGTPNFTLHGALTLRGVTRELSFPAVIAAADADHLTGQAQIEFDRTQFGANYGSGRLFAFLGKHVVNDHVQLHLKLQAKRV
ncbi:MAG: YceI family protein [Prosthecobacter sp.]